MKYPTARTVDAVYDNTLIDAPFSAAMPELMPVQEFRRRMTGFPVIPHNLNEMTSEERRRCLSGLSGFFLPLDYTYVLYDCLYRYIAGSYVLRPGYDAVRQVNSLFAGRAADPLGAQAESGAVLGVPGIGKTSAIRRCLSLMPQVIEHTAYQGKPFYCKQVLYLHVECPSDCSVKALGLNIAYALDRAIGTRYAEQLTSLRSAAASAVATQIKVLCLTHHVGLLVVDEIQNAVQTARKNR